MPAVACLRVVVDSDRADIPRDRLAGLVAKFSEAFLDVRWSWPRQATALGSYCYLLSDPRADHLDTVELARLSQELQVRLFGSGAEDAVKLLLFEGSDGAIARFAGYDEAHILALMEGGAEIGHEGVLRRIAADGSLLPVPEREPGPAPATRTSFSHAIEGSQGVYFTPREVFIGDVVTCTPEDAATYYSLVDGEEHQPVDGDAYCAACVPVAIRTLIEHDVRASLFLPVSFSALMRATSRQAYLELLQVLPAASRPRLSAAVYDVPRAPTFQALSLVRRVLDPHFSGIDLRTADPMFEIGQVPEGAATSVTLVLPSGDPEIRLRTIRRFANHAPAYKKRRIWPGIANIRSQGERELAVSLGVPFITGPGVCRMQIGPLGGRLWPLSSLPVLSGAAR
jgi:hypothetical protein